MAWAPAYSSATSPRPVVVSPAVRVVVPPAQRAMRATYYMDARGLYRVWAEPEYRFYRSLDVPPNEGDTPFATSSSMPHTPAETYTDGEWYISASYFNGVIDSGFLPIGSNGKTYLRFDIESGNKQPAALASPINWQLSQRNGVVRITGLYWRPQKWATSTWAIAYTTDGSEPATDSPTVSEPMDSGPLGGLLGSDGIRVLDTSLPAFANGTIVRVRLQVCNTFGSPTYSEKSTVKTITVDTESPSAPITGTAWPGE